MEVLTLVCFRIEFGLGGVILTGVLTMLSMLLWFKEPLKKMRGKFLKEMDYWRE